MRESVVDHQMVDVLVGDAGLGKSGGAGDAECARGGEILHLADHRGLDALAGAQQVDRLRTHGARLACRNQIFSKCVAAAPRGPRWWDTHSENVRKTPEELVSHLFPSPLILARGKHTMIGGIDAENLASITLHARSASPKSAVYVRLRASLAIGLI